MDASAAADQGLTPEQADVDHYPALIDVLTRLVEDDSIPDVPIERLEVTALASGEATYRYWRARAVDPEGGYLEPV